MSGADPCTGSKTPGASEPGATLALAAIPMPPWIAAARSVRMSAKRFEATTTSRLPGSRTMRGECVHEHPLDLHLGEFDRHLLDHLVPEDVAVAGGVRLRRARQHPPP